MLASNETDEPDITSMGVEFSKAFWSAGKAWVGSNDIDDKLNNAAGCEAPVKTE